jgi:hypothetical protein
VFNNFSKYYIITFSINLDPLIVIVVSSSTGPQNQTIEHLKLCKKLEIKKLVSEFFLSLTLLIFLFIGPTGVGKTEISKVIVYASFWHVLKLCTNLSV